MLRHSNVAPRISYGFPTELRQCDQLGNIDQEGISLRGRPEPCLCLRSPGQLRIPTKSLWIPYGQSGLPSSDFETGCPRSLECPGSCWDAGWPACPVCGLAGLPGTTKLFPTDSLRSPYGFPTEHEGLLQFRPFIQKCLLWFV